MSLLLPERTCYLLLSALCSLLVVYRAGSRLCRARSIFILIPLYSDLGVGAVCGIGIGVVGTLVGKEKGESMGERGGGLCGGVRCTLTMY